VSNRYKVYAVHMAGEVTGSGHIRTLCQGYMATGPSAVKATGTLDEVTCKGCLRRAQVTDLAQDRPAR